MRVIEELEGFASSQLGVVKSWLTMVKLEATLARQSIYPSLLNLLMLFIAVISGWIITLVLLGYIVTQALGSMMIAMILVWLFNLLLCGIFVKCFINNVRRMTFEKTRAYLNAKTRG